MELQEALLKIDAIHAQVAKAETFRGYRPLTVGCTGVLALAAAALQPILVPQPNEQIHAYLQLWIATAALSVTIVGLELALHCWRSPSQFLRRQTLQAIEQFLPCIVAGGALTGVMMKFAPEGAPLLPGLWSIVFSLGVFSSSRQLPPAVLIVAVFYLLAGLATLALARGAFAFTPWAMAGTFGVGQLLTAAILYWTLDRGAESRACPSS